jgi:hypothetical protein
MVLNFKNFINESNNNLELNDNDLWNKIEILRNKYPDFILNIKKSEKFKDAFHVTIYHNDKYLVGIKGPCSLMQAYQTYKSTIEKHNTNESLRDKMKPKSDEEIMKDLDNLTPKQLFIMSVYNNYINGVKIALEKGVDINEIHFGDIALITAINEEYKDMVVFLIKNGADVNIQDDNKNTPLIWASNYGDKEIVEILLKNGADFNLKNIFNETALKKASFYEYKEIIKLLKKYGATK